MITGYAHKQQAEIFPVTVDFVNELATGETITGQTVTARNAQTDADTSATVLQGSPTASSSRVSQTVKAGTSGERHLLTFRITTSAGNTFESEVMLSIEED